MTTADAPPGAARRLVPNAGIVIDKRFVDSMPEDWTAAIEVVTSACLASSCASNCASNSPASVSMQRASVGSAVTSSTSRPSTMTRRPSRKLSLNCAPERRLG